MNNDQSLTMNSQLSISHSSIPQGYKQTEVGVIPEDWEASPLGRFMVLQRGYDLPHRERQAGIIPIITSSGFGGTHSEAKVSGPGVVTGRYGTIGDVFYVQEDFWPLNTTLYVRDFRGNNPLFSSYLLKTIDFHTHSGKSGVPGVNRNDLHEIIIPAPPTIAEQEAIAQALSDTDALLESLEQLLAKKRQIKQGAMQELFCPKPGWEQKQIGDVLSICHGKSQYEVIDENGAYPILASGGHIGKAKEYLYNKPSVLIGRKGTIDKPQYMDSPFWTVDTLFYSIVHEPNEAKYLFYQFCLISWRDFSEASGVPSLNARTIESIKIQIPSPKEQKAIATILSDMDSEIASLETKLTKTRQLKQGMMHQLLTGRIRLI